jgi:hypothetical protein
MTRSRSALVTTDPDWTTSPAPRFAEVPAAAEAGRTERVEVFVDSAMGPRGRRVAAEVLNSVDDDIDALSRHFGGAALVPAPVQVVIAQLPGVERAYHYGPDGSELYCDARTVPQVEPRYTRFLLVALLADLFVTSHGHNWNADDAAGEALVRVLATSRYPKQLAGFATAAVWLNSDRPDCTARPASDQDPVAVGGSVLFLNWLHHQLGYSWREIIAAGSSTLAETYRRLRGDDEHPFPLFAGELELIYPAGRPVDLANDNPYPRTPKPEPTRAQAAPVSNAALADVTAELDGYESVEVDDGDENAPVIELVELDDGTEPVSPT